MGGIDTLSDLKTVNHNGLLPGLELAIDDVIQYCKRSIGMEAMMTKNHFKWILRSSLRIYFAPVVGAWRQMRFELRRVDREIRNSHARQK